MALAILTLQSVGEISPLGRRCPPNTRIHYVPHCRRQRRAIYARPATGAQIQPRPNVCRDPPAGKSCGYRRVASGQSGSRGMSPAPICAAPAAAMTLARFAFEIIVRRLMECASITESISLRYACARDGSFHSARLVRPLPPPPPRPAATPSAKKKRVAVPSGLT